MGDDALMHSRVGLSHRQDYGRIGSLDERVLMLALLAKAGLTDVAIMTGVPVDVWDRRHKLRASWEGEHVVSLGRRDMVITVHEVRCAWQPVLSLYDYALELREAEDGAEVVLAEGMTEERLRRGWLVADCGHNTFDLAGVIGLQPVSIFSGTSAVGGRDVLAVVRERLRQEYGADRDLAELQTCLIQRDGLLDVYEQVVDLKPLVESAANDLAVQVVSEITARVREGSDASRFHGIILTGGPAKALKPVVMGAYPRNAVVALDQLANARGACKFAQGPGVFRDV